MTLARRYMTYQLYQMKRVCQVESWKFKHSLSYVYCTVISCFKLTRTNSWNLRIPRDFSCTKELQVGKLRKRSHFLMRFQKLSRIFVRGVSCHSEYVSRSRIIIEIIHLLFLIYFKIYLCILKKVTMLHT